MFESKVIMHSSISFTEEPKGDGELCPRRNGHYAHPDPTICNIFFNCVDNVAIEVKCTGKQHFNEATGNCEWPHDAGREGCADNDSM